MTEPATPEEWANGPREDAPAPPDAASALVTQAEWLAVNRGQEFVLPPPDDPIRQSIEARFSGDGDCLEIGCYPGRYLAVFGAAGYRVHGLDFHPDTAKAVPDWLRRQGCRIGQFVVADFDSHVFDRQYDVVFSIGFIEHYPRWREVLRRHAALVAPGGALLVTCPNFRGWIQYLIHRLGDPAGLRQHCLDCMQPARWRPLVETQGFEVERAGHIGDFNFWFDRWPESRLLSHFLYQLKRRRRFFAFLSRWFPAAAAPQCLLLATRTPAGAAHHNGADANQ